MQIKNRYGALLNDLFKARELADDFGLKGIALDRIVGDMGNTYDYYKNSLAEYIAKLLSQHAPAPLESITLFIDGEISAYDSAHDYQNAYGKKLAIYAKPAVELILDTGYKGLDIELKRLVMQAAQDD